MIPFKNLLALDTGSSQAIYAQLANGLIRMIRSGMLRLPAYADTSAGQRRSWRECLVCGIDHQEPDAVDADRVSYRSGQNDQGGAVCKRGLWMSDGVSYNPPGRDLNGLRMGFALLEPQEMTDIFRILRRAMGLE